MASELQAGAGICSITCWWSGVTLPLSSGLQGEGRLLPSQPTLCSAGCPGSSSSVWLWSLKDRVLSLTQNLELVSGCGRSCGRGRAQPGLPTRSGCWSAAQAAPEGRGLGSSSAARGSLRLGGARPRGPPWPGRLSASSAGEKPQRGQTPARTLLLRVSLSIQF